MGVFLRTTGSQTSDEKLVVYLVPSGTNMAWVLLNPRNYILELYKQQWINFLTI